MAAVTERIRTLSIVALQHLIGDGTSAPANMALLAAGVGDRLRELLEPSKLRQLPQIERDATLSVLGGLCGAAGAGAQKVAPLIPQLGALLREAPEDTAMGRALASPIASLVKGLGADALQALKDVGFFSWHSHVQPAFPARRRANRPTAPSLTDTWKI